MTHLSCFFSTLNWSAMLLTATSFALSVQKIPKYFDRSYGYAHRESFVVFNTPVLNTPVLLVKNNKLIRALTKVDAGTHAPAPGRRLKWVFRGLTLWLELEECDLDITNAIQDIAAQFGTEKIPRSHATAIYGMTHLTIEEAKEKLYTVKKNIDVWPSFARPAGVHSDISICGENGEEMSMAWCELTLSSSDAHEEAMDTLFSIFFKDYERCDGTPPWNRPRPWKPHISIAYDNPEDGAFSLPELMKYVADHPSLLTKERRVKAISLWDTNGRMEHWKCLDRIFFQY